MRDIPASNEETIGIRGYLTTTRGVEGKLRRSYEDFVVEEVLEDGAVVSVGSGLPDHASREIEGGPYCHFALEKRGIDLFQAIARLSKELGISRKRFTYCGTKDANAVTCQLVSIQALSPTDLRTRSNHLQVYTPFRATRPLRLGGHWGNSFRISVTGIPLTPEETDLRAEATASQIKAHGGVPNFFGHQRFGTLRANTHIVGKHLLKGDFDTAVWEYLGSVFQGERAECIEARLRLLETRDFRAALASFPKDLTYERHMLAHLVDHPRDFLGALRRIPRGLLSLFVRAYQSYIFNLTLSRRIQSNDPFRPIEGDVLQSGHGAFAVGDSISVDEATRLRAEGKARLVYSVVGYASAAEGPVSRDILETMKQEDATSSLFYVRQLPDISPKGGYRDVICPVHNLVLDGAQPGEQGKTNLGLSFRLTRGSYATVVLREFMKADIAAY